MTKRNAKRNSVAVIGAKSRRSSAPSASPEPDFTFGIEEEYFVIDRSTRDLAPDLPRSAFNALRSAIGPGFSPEYMRSQIEIATPVLTTAADARDVLHQYRQTIATGLEPYGLAPLAVATHPFADWREQKHTNKPRYNEIAASLQGLGRRMLVSGLHVHVGIEDADDRIRVMNGLRACLPLFLALSASSPFWQAEPTGLKSYRVAINDATPRRGIPEPFADWKAYEAAIATMVRAGMIEDASHLWWDIRPSSRFPTVETRIADVCPRIEDSVAIAMLVRCFARALWRRAPELEPLFRQSLVIINENRWLAQRYGVFNGFIDPVSEGMKPFADIFGALLDALGEDADELDVISSLDHVRAIAAEGSSADRQLATYDEAIADGLPASAALRKVVDQLADETVCGPVHGAHVAATRPASAEMVRPGEPGS